MYLPEHFREARVDILHATLRRHPLASLVTHGPEGLVASPVPMLLDPEPGPFGTLHGHIARANPQWKQAASGGEALALFMGADAYVSPSHYATKRETGRVVPTWNYIAVQAAGPVEFYDDRERLLRLVTRLTERHEHSREQPWAVSDAPADYIKAMLNGIIGIELRVRRLDGKWKLSQNRSEADRAGVTAGLADEAPDVAHEMKR